jgi:hypothetical protein
MIYVGFFHLNNFSYVLTKTVSVIISHYCYAHIGIELLLFLQMVPAKSIRLALTTTTK